MLNHKQTTFGDGSDGKESGNCFSTAIASILELPIDEVPNFCQHRDWQARLLAWLKDRGMTFFEITLTDDMRQPDFDWSGNYIENLGYCVISGPAARGLNHSIVGYAGKALHDPHPSDAMLIEHHYIGFIVPLNPAIAS